ncbi:MAG: c-type cytochrome [Caldilineales bacterium]
MPGFSLSHAKRLLGAGLLLAALLMLLSAVAWAQSGGDITRGSQIFDANCAVCHGSDGKGRVGANLSNQFSAIDPAAFTRAVIEQGVTGTPMIAWSKQYGGILDDQQIEDVVAFVSSLSGGRSAMAPTATPMPVTPVPTVPGATGDATHGKQLFDQNCVMCHGDYGQGRIGANLSKGFASINPQQFVRATVADGISGSAMPSWSQAKGGPLSDADIDDISSYIMTLKGKATTVAAASSTALGTQSPAAQEKGSNWLMILLVLVLAVVLVALIMMFSGRNKPTP